MITCESCGYQWECNGAIYVGPCPQCKVKMVKMNDWAVEIDGVIHIDGCQGEHTEMAR